MNTLVTALVLWLSANFGLPAVDAQPRIEFVPAAQITALRYKAFAGAPLEKAAPAAQPGERQVVAVYDASTGTIYLPEGWTGHTVAELSILVHELVHYLQHRAKATFECPQQREELAYKAQTQWLALFGRDLESEFELDPFTVFASTKCFF